jgi:hypothetical protein
MKRKSLEWMVAASLLAVSVGFAVGQGPPRSGSGMERPPRPSMLGRDLMTPLERAQFRARIQTAKTPEERDRIRQEHRERLERRAREQGVVLPVEPLERGLGRVGRGSGGREPRGDKGPHDGLMPRSGVFGSPGG